jgi:hypothetical protein
VVQAKEILTVGDLAIEVGTSPIMDLQHARVRRCDAVDGSPAHAVERVPQLQRWRAGHCAWRPPEIDGERGLMLAVLSDAVVCYQLFHAASGRHERRLFQEAQSWLMSEQTDAALSCTLACDALGIDTERLREALRQWRRARSGLRAVAMSERAL